MIIDVVGALSDLAARRPVFHSERDFQHALAWQIQLNYPQAQIRLETRPRRSVHLDMLIRLDGTRTAVELKYLVVAALHAIIGEESYDLPHQSANDISRHDVMGDITRIKAALADGHADSGCVVVLTNDRSYWQPATKADTIDAAFRLRLGGRRAPDGQQLRVGQHAARDDEHLGPGTREQLDGIAVTAELGHQHPHRTPPSVLAA